MTDFNADECARLIAEVREGGWVQPPAKPLADQLEAAVREIDQMNSEGGTIYRGTKKLIAERNALLAKVAKLTSERDGMRAVADAACRRVDNWRDMTAEEDGSSDLDDAVDAYRAAKERP